MYTLYYTTKSYTTESTALIVRIALEEVGAPFEVIEVELDPSPPTWFLDINPNGKIPTMEVLPESADGTKYAIHPSPAILLALADQHPKSGLLPDANTARALCYTRLMDMVEILHSAFNRVFFTDRYSTENTHVPHIRNKAIMCISKYFQNVEAQLSETVGLVGDRFTLCDIYLYVMARWYVDLGAGQDQNSQRPLQEYPHLSRIIAETELRPAVQRALAADELHPVLRETMKMKGNIYV